MRCPLRPAELSEFWSSCRILQKCLLNPRPNRDMLIPITKIM